MGRRLALLGGAPAFPEVVPIVRPWLPPAAELLPDIETAFGSGMITNDRFVRSLEEAFAAYVGTREAVAVCSCTSGLILLLRVLDLHGPVVLPSYTFLATGLALAWNGLPMAFGDIDPATHTLDPASAEAVLKSEHGRAILAVHTYGCPPELETMERLAAQAGVPLLIDAAHGMGGRYHNRPLGGFGLAEVFSLSPTKTLTAGEGGIITTNDRALAARLRIARNYGDPGTNDAELVGLNARMPELSAILGLKCLPLLEENVRRRNQIARTYLESLAEVPGLLFPQVPPGSLSTYKDFSLLVLPEEFGLTRDQLAEALRAENVMCRRYFATPLHRQKAFASPLYRRPDYDARLPHTDYVAARVISLPCFAQLSEATARRIAELIREAHEQAEAIVAALSRRANQPQEQV